MLFSSVPFLFYFLPCVLLVYFLVPGTLKNGVLLLASLLFYGWGEPRYLLVMLAAIAQGYVFGLLIEKSRGKRRAGLYLALSVLLSLGTLAKALGVTLTEDYETITADQPFYGVYCGQSALPLEPEPLRYLTNDTLRGCTVYDYETGSELPVYDLQQLAGEDAYAVFLSGSKALLTITNPAAKTDRELVVFRDSFASSLTPLLAGAYAKITLVDIRYLQPERLGTWLTFDTQDVLFLYSAPVLNSSETIR